MARPIKLSLLVVAALVLFVTQDFVTGILHLLWVSPHSAWTWVCDFISRAMH